MMEWGVMIIPILAQGRIRPACRLRNHAQFNARFANSQRSLHETSASGSVGPEILA
jgi:hypothetical protein